jgi:hypothetical protein
MEAQPIALLLILLSFSFTGVVNAWPLGEIAVTLLLLGLRWWAMLVYWLMARGMSKTEGQPLHVLGLFLALAAMIGTHLWFVNILGAAIVGGALVIWFWIRGIQVVQAQEREVVFLQYFRIGFCIMLLELLITIFSSSDASLRVTATRLFTTFFLSGLLTLSFARLRSMVGSGGENAAQTAAGRNWRVALTLVWCVIIGLALLLESFSFQSIQRLLQPLWDVLGWLANGIAYIISVTFSFLFAGLLGKPKLTLPPPSASPNAPTGTPNISPQALLAGRMVVLLIVFSLLLLVIVIFLRRWNVRLRDEDEEEVRESLPVREVARKRQEEQRRAQQEAVLEQLPPDSARAHYRDLLQTMAWQREELARKAEETPHDYEQRLITMLRSLPPDVAHEPHSSSDAHLLDTLTQAYIEERYGGKHVPQPEQTHTWAERLATRLSGLVRKDGNKWNG